MIVFAPTYDIKKGKKAVARHVRQFSTIKVGERNDLN